MSEDGDPPHFIVPLKPLGSRNGQSSCPVPSVPTRKRISPEGRAMLTRTFDGGCHFPTKAQKEALLRELQKTDPGYTLQKLSTWFISRRHRHAFQESQKEQKDGQDYLTTLLDPTTALAREMWPSLSADTLRCLHKMLLEQPHITVQHQEMLASHFGVERKHVETFLNWRVAYVRPENNRLWGDDLQRERKHLSSTVADDDIMDVDDPSEPRVHLPTPAGSTSPEPLPHKTPFVYVQMHHQPSVDVGPSASVEHGSSGLRTTGSTLGSYLQSPISPLCGFPSTTTPHQTNSLATTNLPSPSHDQLFHANPIQLLPPSLSRLSIMPSGDAGRVTSGIGPKNRSRPLASAAPVKPPQADGPPIPRTLREFEEAYAPTYARFERFLQAVGRGKCAHVGLTPEMLNEIKP